MSENSLNKPFILPSAASFFASFVASSQYVKQSKHLLNLKKKKPTQTDAHILILSRFPCFCLVALQCHIEYGENIFLETNKAVKLYRSV